MTTTTATVTQQRRVVTPIPGPRSVELQSHRVSHVAQGLGTVLPVFVERAEGGIIVDVDGNHLIDFGTGIAVTSVGASHPDVVHAVQRQAEKFTHTCFMVTEYQGYADVCARLNALAPGSHDKRTALFTSGAEALENAVKIARAYTGRPGVVVFDHAYHGRTMFTLGMTGKEAPYKVGFAPFPEHIHRAPLAQALRWPGDPNRCVEEALQQLRDLLQRVGADTIAAMVIEPVIGEGGFIVPEPGFLAGLRAICDEHGIVFVADEVQAGMGRTGTLLAVEHDDVVPDLICTAKALAGGLPISAVTGRTEIMNVVGPGGIGGTYAGNPLACAAALAVLDLLERDTQLLDAARRTEAVVREVLEPVAQRTGVIAEIRGRGAMMAVEFVKKGTLEPDAELTKRVATACHAAGVVILTCGTYGNVVRLLPPLVMEEALLRDGLGVLADAIVTAAG